MDCAFENSFQVFDLRPYWETWVLSLNVNSKIDTNDAKAKIATTTTTTTKKNQYHTPQNLPTADSFLILNKLEGSHSIDKW